MFLLQIFTGFGALAFVGVALSFARFDEFRTAFWLLVIAGIVSLLGGGWSEMASTDPFWLRAVDGAATGIATFLICPMLIVWLQKKESAWQSKQRLDG